MRLLAPTDDGLVQAAKSLRAGHVVAYPTETVYGLGVDPFSVAALERLFDIKGRERGQPVLLIVGSAEQLEAIVSDVSRAARALIDAFWPGPLSLLFRPASNLPRPLLGPGGRVCVRHTSCPTAARLCDAFGGAIVSTSANRTGEPPAMSVDEIRLDGIDLAIDGGRLETGVPSTVCDPESGEVLRAGAIATQAIADALRNAAGL